MFLVFVVQALLFRVWKFKEFALGFRAWVFRVLTVYVWP